MNCTYHNQNPTTMIRIAPHKCQCQRKLCAECLKYHGVETKYIVSSKKFQEKAQKKLEESKLNDTSELNKQRMNFKQMLSRTERMLTKIWEELSQSIQQLYDWINKANQSFIKIINENPAELAYIDFKTLYPMIEGSSIVSTLYFSKILKNIQEHEFNAKDYSAESQDQIKEDLIKKIDNDKKIIQFQKFFIHLTFCEQKFVRCGSNSLNLLLQMKGDQTYQSFELL